MVQCEAYNDAMTEVSSGSERLLDQYMQALDRYGLARAEMEAVETSETLADTKAVADRVQKATWEFVEARHKYKRRKSLSAVSQARTA
jgi:hypothetical protein